MDNIDLSLLDDNELLELLNILEGMNDSLDEIEMSDTNE